MITRSINTFFAQGTVSSTAMSLTNAAFGFTATQVAQADHVLISVDTGAIRITWDAAKTVPTTSKGMVITDRNWPLADIVGTINAQNIQMIRDGSTDAVVNVMLECG